FVVTFIGFLGTRFFFGRWLVDFFDFLFERTPGINFLYTTVKEVLNSFMGDKKKFNDPVWVKTNETPEIWRIGFLTQKEADTPYFRGLVRFYPYRIIELWR